MISIPIPYTSHQEFRYQLGTRVPLALRVRVEQLASGQPPHEKQRNFHPTVQSLIAGFLNSVLRYVT